MKTIVTIFAIALGSPCLAQDQIEPTEGLLPMPEHVKANIEELRTYGDRFEKAIIAIEAQWAKPVWTDCDAEPYLDDGLS